MSKNVTISYNGKTVKVLPDLLADILNHASDGLFNYTESLMEDFTLEEGYDKEKYRLEAVGLAIEHIQLGIDLTTDL